MLVVNDSAICRGRMGSGLLSPYTSEHLTLARGNEAIPEPAPLDPGGTPLKPVAVHSYRLGRVMGTN